MVWLNIPLLVSSNTAGNVQRSPSKQPVLLPQTQLGMSRLPVKYIWFWSPQTWLEMSSIAQTYYKSLISCQ